MSSSGTTKKEQRALRANSGNSLFSLVLVDRTYRFSSELDIKSKSVPVFPLLIHITYVRDTVHTIFYMYLSISGSQKKGSTL